VKVLVTGGCGFIFSNFIRFALKKHPSWEIINLDALTYAGRLENTKDFVKNKNYTFIKGNICNQKIVEQLVKKADIIINAAAESHVDRAFQKPVDFIKTNVYGTYVLLEAAKKHKIKLFIQIGTDECYGSIKKGYFKESDPLCPSSPYSASKASADLLALSYFTTYGLPVIVTRTTNNFGPYQFPEKFLPRLITNGLLGKNLPVYGQGKNVRDWLYVLDNCRAIDLVIQKGQPGEIYNIGHGGREYTNLEVAKMIVEKLDTKIEFVADRPGHDLRYALNCDKIKKLGFKPSYDFKKGLETTINWYQQNPWWWQPLKDRAEKIYKEWGRKFKR
jgi:dTDP-glucose 4,6-dehydratase